MNFMFWKSSDNSFTTKVMLLKSSERISLDKLNVISSSLFEREEFTKKTQRQDIISSLQAFSQMSFLKGGQCLSSNGDGIIVVNREIDFAIIPLVRTYDNRRFNNIKMGIVLALLAESCFRTVNWTVVIIKISNQHTELGKCFGTAQLRTEHRVKSELSYYRF